MKYRSLKNNDYTLNSFLSNTPECVAQAVVTRLRLFTKEWFLNTLEGTPWYEGILGHNTNYDLEIRSRILGTKGVVSILEYASQLNTERELSVQATLETLYGTVQVTV